MNDVQKHMNDTQKQLEQYNLLEETTTDLPTFGLGELKAIFAAADAREERSFTMTAHEGYKLGFMRGLEYAKKEAAPKD